MLSVEPLHIKELDKNHELLQTGFWAVFREQFSWKAHAFRCIYSEKEFNLLVLTRTLRLGLRLAYVPLGPCIEPDQRDLRGEFLIELGRALAGFLPGGTVFIRFDLPWGQVGNGNLPEPLDTSSGLRKAAMDIQPPNTVLIDLGATEDEILAAMKPKTRYNIRLACKKGVEVVEGSREDLKDWYALYRETARRDLITLHSFEYYKSLFELSDAYSSDTEAGVPAVVLLLAEAEGELLAGIVVAFKGRGARYMYGASSSRKRNLMPGYVLQWRAIQLAKARGCETYDLFGIPPSSDPDHPMHGLYRFKTGFGGEIFNRFGCYDLPLSSFRYRIFRTAETARKLYYHRIRKRHRH